MRSKLFVPGSRPDLFPKALAGAADALSFDLEDAVTEDRKGEARAQVVALLNAPAAQASPKRLVVRINALGTPHFQADVEALAATSLGVINLPKTESPEEIHALVDAIARHRKESGIRILATIETPKGLRRAAEIAAAHPRVMGLQLGLADLFEPFQIARHSVANVHAAQFALRLAAAEASVLAFDAAFSDVKDPEGFKAEAQRAQQLGFAGKSCIHPSQVALANEVFRPSDEEIAHAVKVLAAWELNREQGSGAFLVEGKMIDVAFVSRARSVVAMARERGVLP